MKQKEKYMQNKGKKEKVIHIHNQSASTKITALSPLGWSWRQELIFTATPNLNLFLSLLRYVLLTESKS
jgi:hypothetical protein